jgi:hypothetical protein
MQLNPDGDLLWAFQTGDTSKYSSSYAHSKICIDSLGNMYLTGIFSGTADFDPGPAIQNVSSTDIGDNYIVKFDQNANLLWVKSLRLYGLPMQISVNQGGDVFLTGLFNDTVDFDPGPGVALLYGEQGDHSHFFLKLTTNGDYSWANHLFLGGSYTSYCDLECDIEGNLYFTGPFNDTVDFDPGPATYNLMSSSLYGASFLLKLGQEGSLVWVTKNGEFSNGTYHRNDCLYLDSHHNIYTCGGFSGIRDFDPDTSTYNMTSNSSQDMFIQRLWQCPPAAATLNLEVCQNITLNGETYYNSGTYSQFLTSTEGCDSILTLNLNIHHINTAVLQSGITLTAADTTLNYQWVDCDNGFSPIAGQNGLSFTPTANGHYAVIIDDGFCSDTSACVEITTVGIPETESESNFNIFPNPGSGSFSISAGFYFTDLYLEVFDIYGKKIDSRILKNSEGLNFNIPGSSGMYFVRLVTTDKASAIKLIKN